MDRSALTGAWGLRRRSALGSCGVNIPDSTRRSLATVCRCTRGPTRCQGGRGKRRARDPRDAGNGPRHGRAAPCRDQTQGASPFAETLAWDAGVCQTGAKCTLAGALGGAPPHRPSPAVCCLRRQPPRGSDHGLGMNRRKRFSPRGAGRIPGDRYRRADGFVIGRQFHRQISALTRLAWVKHPRAHPCLPCPLELWWTSAISRIGYTPPHRDRDTEQVPQFRRYGRCPREPGLLRATGLWFLWMGLGQWHCSAIHSHSPAQTGPSVSPGPGRRRRLAFNTRHGAGSALWAED